MSIDEKIFFNKGDLIYEEGDTKLSLYFVLKGTVKLQRKDSEGKDKVVKVLGEKSILGTIPFLEGIPKSSTAIARTDVECLVIDSQRRQELLATVPSWFRYLTIDLSQNIIQTYGRLQQVKEEYTKLSDDYQYMKENLNKKKDDIQRAKARIKSIQDNIEDLKYTG